MTDVEWLLERAVWRVKETATHYVEIMPMIFNYRIVLTPKSNDQIVDGGWCYFGKGGDSLTAAMVAAELWDPDTEMRPAGFGKEALPRMDVGA
jgi:hypothetical protein